MTQPRTVNLQTGLPASVDASNPQELQRVLNRILAVLATWNGEVGDAGDRLITSREHSQ